MEGALIMLPLLAQEQDLSSYALRLFCEDVVNFDLSQVIKSVTDSQRVHCLESLVNFLDIVKTTSVSSEAVSLCFYFLSLLFQAPWLEGSFESCLRVMDKIFVQVILAICNLFNI
jgi:hypothetical protein